MKKHKISISFAKNYEDVYEFLIQKPNISQFICKIIREKVMQEQEVSLEQQVEMILDKLIKEKRLSIDHRVNSLNPHSDILENTDKNLINSLF